MNETKGGDSFHQQEWSDWTHNFLVFESMRGSLATTIVATKKLPSDSVVIMAMENPSYRRFFHYSLNL